MSGSQNVLKIFGILEIISCVENHTGLDFTLIDVILSAASIILAISNKAGIFIEIITRVLNLIVFVAANNVKRANH